MLAILISVHIPLEIRGRMKWQKIRWEHVSESARGTCCPTWCLCVWRLFCCSAAPGLSWSDAPRLLSDFPGGVAGAAARGISDFRFHDQVSGVQLRVQVVIDLPWGITTCPGTGSDMGLLSWPALASHNLNFFFMLMEALVNRLCITTYHLTFIFYYGAIYVIFSWVFFHFYHFFFYFFIDWRYPGVLIGHLDQLLTCDLFSLECGARSALTPGQDRQLDGHE
eukprot:Skav200067  [mRNA]  locus=scaffold838:135742:142365:- [translate_table: standard]